MMKTNTQSKLSGIAVVVGCALFTIWTLYLLLTEQIISGTLYGTLTACGWFITTLYFGNEVRKDFKKDIG